MEKYSINEVAEKLKISPNTLRAWDNKLSLSERNSHGNRVYTEQNISLLSKVQELRTSGSGFNTIVKKLNIPIPEPATNTQPTDNNNKTDIQPIYNLLKTELQAVYSRIDGIQSNITEVTSLSEALSKTSYHLGTVEQEKKHLTERLLSVTESNQELKNKLSALEQENKHLQEQLQAEKNKSFFKRLFGL